MNRLVLPCWLTSQSVAAMLFGKNHEKIHFKTDAAGRKAFYPFGIFGKGYVVSPAEASGLETYIRRQMAFAATLILVEIGLQVIIGVGKALAIVGGPILLFLILFHLGLRRRTKGLPVSETPMTMTDTIGNQARHMSALRAYGLVFVGIVMTLASGYTALHAQGTTAWAGAAGVLFFGYGLVHLLRIVRVRWTDH